MQTVVLGRDARHTGAGDALVELHAGAGCGTPLAVGSRMAKNKTTNYPGEGSRTPGTAEGERNPADQNDRADEDILNQADDDEDEFDDADDEDEEADEEDV